MQKQLLWLVSLLLLWFSCGTYFSGLCLHWNLQVFLCSYSLHRQWGWTSTELPAPTHMASVRFPHHLIMSYTYLAQVPKHKPFSQYVFMLSEDPWRFSVFMGRLFLSFPDSSTEYKFLTLLHNSSPTLYSGTMEIQQEREEEREGENECVFVSMCEYWHADTITST